MNNNTICDTLEWNIKWNFLWHYMYSNYSCGKIIYGVDKAIVEHEWKVLTSNIENNIGALKSFTSWNMILEI